MTKRERLEAAGFIVGKRDPAMNTAFTGQFMVSEEYDEGHTQPDGSGGIWCIVGDDLNALIETASQFYDELTA